MADDENKTRVRHQIRNGESLAEAYPALEAEWDYKRNGDLLPTQVRPGSSRKVWWKCATCGWEWGAYVNNRTKKGSGCPACAGRVPRVGENDVATLYPELMLDWDWRRNKGINPSQLMRTNRVDVSWKCHVCGNEWVTALTTRTLHDSGCPVCRERDRVEQGSLMVERYPDVASEWNFVKNRGIDIMAVAQYSDMKVWWRCRECGYEWEARVRNRTNGRTGCPRCAERKKAQRVVESFAEQGGIVVVGVTFDAATGEVFSGLGRCGRIRLYELPVGFDVSQAGSVGGSRVKGDKRTVLLSPPGEGVALDAGVNARKAPQGFSLSENGELEARPYEGEGGKGVPDGSGSIARSDGSVGDPQKVTKEPSFCHPEEVEFARVRDLDCEGLKREGIVRLLNEERVTFFITGELGGNAMVSMGATGTTCYYDVEGDAETRVRELLVGKLRAKELAHAKVQRL